MTVFKVTVKSTFYLEAEHVPAAKKIVESALQKLPNFEFSLKATKRVNTGLSFESLTKQN